MLLCADHSRAVGESLIGTAPRVDTWFLLEYNAAWGAKALPESHLPDVVKAHLQAIVDTVPQARMMFIRQPQRRADHIVFYVVDSLSAHIMAFALKSYDELLDFDPHTRYGLVPMSPPHSLYLVCTNGRRDVSCAAYGVPLYEQMTAYASAEVWQSTHLGGHRFAATVACLPHGLVYGHVEPQTAPDFVERYRRGEVDLAHYRGRSIYDPPVQAAEHFLLGQGLDGLRLQGVRQQEPFVWTVEFNTDAESYSVRVERQLSTYDVYKSTGDAQPVSVPVWRADLIQSDVA